MSMGTEVRRIADSASAAGITLSSLSNGLGWMYPLTASDPAVRRQGTEVMRAALRAARWELIPEAEAQGAFIGVENVWNKFLLSPLEMARFVDEIGSPWIGMSPRSG